MTTETTADASRLDAYHFYEDDWEDYDHLREGFEWDVPERANIASYLCDRWANDEGRVALYAENEAGAERSYTFAELQETANRLANYLAERGVERGDRVGVNAPQKPETVFAHVAAWKLGAVSVPLSTLFGPDALGYRLDDSDAVACVVDESNLDALRAVRDDCPALETVVTVDGDPDGDETDFWDAIDGRSSDFETVDTDAEADAIVIYTSGTTGEPKGVRHAHRVIFGHLPLFLTTFCNMELDSDDTFWTPSEWAWVASLFDVVFPGLYYGKPVLAYAGGPFDAEKAFELVETYGVTNFFAPATALRMMMQVDSSKYDVDDLRVIASGGESLGQSIVEWAEDVFAGAAVHEGYGQTEANLTIGDCTALMEFREGTMGRAAPGMEVAIVDPETAEPTVEAGELGEIAVRYDGNPVCFKEYWRKPDRTERKVKNGWLLTEDLGSMDPDGYIAFESRTDDVIISSGYRIGPVEVEESLASHPAVADAAVVGVPDDERGEIPKAFVVCTAGHEASPDLATEIQNHVKERLAAYEYPREVEFVDDLPKTETGKVRRASLRDEEGVGSEETA
ncbi:acyl-CoA synthetase [Halococcus hamelinensis]|uniref:AMP-dependent synthetase and ligase n=1 Tax=Halococcus hamelinensis 100A6 TaxID=1132509 RepID=M0LUX7_9EURY|nr:AMP-binding protein [Halococcus hamelinensis]EMA36179.1 AMP-dependent synthetase and ligase [Halococcus hamelinensis 100A6]